MNHSESIANLAAALAEAQSEFSAVPEQATNPFLKNRYADLGTVISTAEPVLAKHGLSVSQPVIGGDGSIGVATILMHKSGEWIQSMATLPLFEEKGKSAAQVAGSIITYLRRYAYSSVLGLYTEEDTDGGAQTSQRPSAPAQNTRPQQPAGGQSPTQQSAEPQKSAGKGETPQDWAIDWLKRVGARDYKTITDKRSAIESMGAHLAAGGIDRPKIRRLAGTLQQWANPAVQVTQENVWDLIDSSLISALTEANSGELLMLKKLADK